MLVKLDGVAVYQRLHFHSRFFTACAFNIFHIRDVTPRITQHNTIGRHVDVRIGPKSAWWTLPTSGLRNLNVC